MSERMTAEELRAQGESLTACQAEVMRGQDDTALRRLALETAQVLSRVVDDLAEDRNGADARGKGAYDA